MRILQLIDSLDGGGAERMAVNYANGLLDRIEFSALVATRKEGMLKDSIINGVSYLFLNRKKTMDLNAISVLKKFVKKNEIQYIHAHSTSIFLAVLVKLLYPKIKVIWHDHYGNSEFLKKRPFTTLKLLSFFLEGIISVNEPLKNWANKNLKTTNVTYLPNFSPVRENEVMVTKVKGIPGKRIVCLANLREQKNHFLLLEVAFELKKSHPEWTFHLVGKNFHDNYAERLQSKIKELILENHVLIYGSCSDTTSILNQMDVGILTSASEGLPLALLEYGSANLPCVVTEVGEIPNIIINNSNGLTVPKGNAVIFATQLKSLMDSKDLQNSLGAALAITISERFANEVILDKYLKWIKSNL